jgi:hypothetical protein
VRRDNLGAAAGSVTAGSAARKGAVGMCRSTAYNGKFRRKRRCFDLNASEMCAYGGSGRELGECVVTSEPVPGRGR